MKQKEIECLSLFCDVEIVEEEERVEVFVKDNNDFWVKKEVVKI